MIFLTLSSLAAIIALAVRTENRKPVRPLV